MLRQSPAPVLLAVAALAMGCASYQRRPIDLGAHLAKWRAQGPSDPRVRARASLDGTAYDAADGLDRGEATLLALVLNPRARAARLRADAVAAGVGLAGTWSDPALSTELRRAIGTGSSPWIVSSGLSITIPLSGRLSAERDGAAAGASAARLGALLVEHDLRLAVSRAWLKWSLAVERSRLLRQYQQALGPLLDQARRLNVAGELAAEQLGILTLETTEYRIRVLRASADESEQREQLLTLIGLTAAAKVVLQPGLDVNAPPATAPAGWPTRQTRVQLKLAEYEVREQALRREVARQYPDLTIGPTFEFDRGQSSIGLGLGLLPIPMFNRNRHAIAEATGRRTVARALVEDAAQQLVAKTELLRARAARASQELDALVAFAAEIDRQLSRLTRLAAQGELDVLVLRHVLQTGLQNRLAIVQTRSDRADAFAQLAVLLTVEPEPEAEAGPEPADGGAP